MSLLAIRVGLINEAQEPIALQAAADENTSGRWFTANLNFSTVLTAVTAFVSLVGAYYSLQNTNARQDAQIASNASAIQQGQADFKKTVVSREEYQNYKLDQEAVINRLQAQQLQIYSVLLTRVQERPR